jgi:hypothetical protein
MLEKLGELLKHPEAKQRLGLEGLRGEEQARRLREIFGLPLVQLDLLGSAKRV